MRLMNKVVYSIFMQVKHAKFTISEIMYSTKKKVKALFVDYI